MSIIIQQDATIYSLFISVNCCTCFGRYHHPSSAARNTVSTVSGINETCTATCRERRWWWVKYRPKYVEQLTDLNKLCSVASCWIFIATLYDARSIEHKVLFRIAGTSSKGKFKSLKPSGFCMYCCTKCRETEEVYRRMFISAVYMKYAVNSDCVPSKNEPTGLSVRDIPCSLWGRNWVCTCDITNLLFAVSMHLMALNTQFFYLSN